MKHIVITGCTGLIGSAIIKQALSQQYEVTCIVRRNSSRIDNIPKSGCVNIIECNIDEYGRLDTQIKADIFIHLAWDKTFGMGRDDVSSQLANIHYTIDAVQLASRIGCTVFIGAGSQAEYGIQEVKLTPELNVNPESGYGIAKYTAGKLAKLQCEQLGLRFNWLRILSIYGKNDAAHTLISYVVEELKNGRSPELTKCEQYWDYLNCEDAARAFLAVAEKGVDGKFYPLGSGDGRKLSDYICDIQKIINPDVKIGFGKKEYYPHQPMYLVADISELSIDTGWNPNISFENGIKSII